MHTGTFSRAGSGLIGTASCLLVVRPADVSEGMILAATGALSSFATIAFLRYLGRLLRGSPQEEPAVIPSFNLKPQIMKTKTPRRHVGRDARTGRFITLKQARQCPDTTVVEAAGHQIRRHRRKRIS